MKEENEAARRKADKELAAAKRLADEQEFTRAIELQKAQKAELAREKARMREILERDKRERFGGSAAAAGAAAKQPEKTPKEQVEHGIKTVKTLYTEIRQPGVAKTCLKTAATFMKNVLKDPSNEKFRKINLDNEAVQKRLGKVNGGLAIMRGVGFKQNPDGSNTYVIEDPDVKVLQEAVDLLAPHYD